MKVIELTKGFVTVISKQDYRRVSKVSWHVHMSRGTKKKPGQPYARGSVGGKKVYLHRFITGAFNPWHVDHKNHQTLDNRRENLEIVSREENMKRRRKK